MLVRFDSEVLINKTRTLGFLHFAKAQVGMTDIDSPLSPRLTIYCHPDRSGGISILVRFDGETLINKMGALRFLHSAKAPVETTDINSPLSSRLIIYCHPDLSGGISILVRFDSETLINKIEALRFLHFAKASVRMTSTSEP